MTITESRSCDHIGSLWLTGSHLELLQGRPRAFATAPTRGLPLWGLRGCTYDLRLLTDPRLQIGSCDPSLCASLYRCSSGYSPAKIGPLGFQNPSWYL